MKLEQQVCSLELSKKLKELGVKQESLFYWFPFKEQAVLAHNSAHAVSLAEKDKADVYGCENPYSAFTVPELGEMLPKNYVLHKKSYSGLTDWWICCKLEDLADTNPEPEGYGWNANPASSIAEVLIYLLENKTIKSDI